MKIIYYSPHPTHDIVSEVGYSTHQRETIAAMRSLGHDVHPIIIGGTDQAVVKNYLEDIQQKSKWKKLLIQFLPKVLLNTLKDIRLIRHDRRAASDLKKGIEKFHPDLVYERNEYMQDRGTILCSKLGVKHYLEVNSPGVEEMRSFEGPSLLHFLGHRKERKKMADTSRIIAVSSSLKNYIIEKYSPKAPILVIPNGINPTLDNTNLNAGKEIREALGWDDKIIFGFVGSIFPYHGVHKLINAFSTVHKSFPQIRLCIVGDGYMRKEYERLAAKNVEAGACKFVGKVPHQKALEYMQAFDVCVMPDSNWYGSPVKILEYGWMKKPVIAPDLGPLRDIMQNRRDGYLVEPNAESLAVAMEYAIEHPEFSAQLGFGFHQKISEQFTWSKLTEEILSA